MKTYNVTVNEATPFPGGVGNKEWFATRVEAESLIEALGNAYFAAQAAVDAEHEPRPGYVAGPASDPVAVEQWQETQDILKDPEAMAGLAEARGEKGACGRCGCLWDHPVHDDPTSGAGPYEIDGVLYALHTWKADGPNGLYQIRVRLHSLGWARETTNGYQPMYEVRWDDGTYGLYFPFNVEVVK